MRRSDASQCRLRRPSASRGGSVHLPLERAGGRPPRRISGKTGRRTMIEAVMFWNEPNNKSHWDFQLDPAWTTYANMVKLAATAVAKENPRLLRVLGGMSPIDRHFVL